MLEKLGNSVQGQDDTAENNVNAEFVSQNSISQENSLAQQSRHDQVNNLYVIFDSVHV